MLHNDQNCSLLGNELYKKNKKFLLSLLGNDTHNFTLSFQCKSKLGLPSH